MSQGGGLNRLPDYKTTGVEVPNTKGAGYVESLDKKGLENLAYKVKIRLNSTEQGKENNSDLGKEKIVTPDEKYKIEAQIAKNEGLPDLSKMITNDGINYIDSTTPGLKFKKINNGPNGEKNLFMVTNDSVPVTNGKDNQIKMVKLFDYNVLNA